MSGISPPDDDTARASSPSLQESKKTSAELKRLRLEIDKKIQDQTNQNDALLRAEHRSDPESSLPYQGYQNEYEYTGHNIQMVRDQALLTGYHHPIPHQVLVAPPAIHHGPLGPWGSPGYYSPLMPYTRHGYMPSYSVPHPSSNAVAFSLPKQSPPKFGPTLHPTRVHPGSKRDDIKRADFKTQIENFTASHPTCGRYHPYIAPGRPVVVVNKKHTPPSSVETSSQSLIEETASFGGKIAAMSSFSRDCLPLEHSSQSVMSSSSSNISSQSNLALKQRPSYLSPRTVVVRDSNHTIHQNLQRLRFLQLQTNSWELFKSTCDELLSWCSDKRAFSVEFAGQLNRTLQRVFERAFVTAAHCHLAKQVLLVSFRFNDIMEPALRENIREWLNIIREYSFGKTEEEKLKYPHNKAVLNSVALKRQTELDDASKQKLLARSKKNLSATSKSSIYLKTPAQSLANIAYMEQLEEEYKQEVETSSKNTAKKYIKWIEDPVESFELLPLARNVEVSFSVDKDKIKYFNQTSDFPIDSQFRLTCYEKHDRSKTHKWPISLTKLEMNSFKLDLQKKIYIQSHSRDATRAVGFHVPIDLSPYLKLGNNIIKLTFDPKEAFQSAFIVKIEVIQLLTKKQVLETVRRKQLLQHESTINLIEKILLPSEDEDVQIIQDTMSLDLTCPLTFMRIVTPVRGIQCKHPRCFDLETFLEMNIRSTTLTCPLCSNTLTIDQIFVDQFLSKVLSEVQDNVRKITIAPDGKWSPVIEQSSSEKKTPGIQLNHGC